MQGLSSDPLDFLWRTFVTEAAENHIAATKGFLMPCKWTGLHLHRHPAPKSPRAGPTQVCSLPRVLLLSSPQCADTALVYAPCWDDEHQYKQYHTQSCLLWRYKLDY